MALGEGEDGGFGGAADLTGGAGGDGGGEQQQQHQQDGGGDAGGSFAAPDWFEKLSATPGEADAPSNRDWATATGVKDLDSLVKIARDSQRAARDKGGIKVPGEGAKPEEVTAFRTAIGVPEKVDGYEVAPIANGQFDPSRAEGPDNPKNIPLNEPLVNALRESALKHGAPAGAFAGMVGDFIQLQMDEAAETKKAQDTAVADKLKEWGGNRDAQLAHIDAAARGLGLTRDEMAWFRTMPSGAGRALDLLAKLGSGMAEDVLITGGKGRFGVSGAEAKTELDRLKADPEFVKKAMTPGSPEKARYDRLNQAAAEYQAAQDQAA